MYTLIRYVPTGQGQEDHDEWAESAMVGDRLLLLWVGVDEEGENIWWYLSRIKIIDSIIPPSRGYAIYGVLVRCICYTFFLLGGRNEIVVGYYSQQCKVFNCEKMFYVQVAEVMDVVEIDIKYSNKTVISLLFTIKHTL